MHSAGSGFAAFRQTKLWVR